MRGGVGDKQMFPRQTKRTETGLGGLESLILESPILESA